MVAIGTVDISIFETLGTLAQPLFFGNTKTIPRLLQIFRRANADFNKMCEFVAGNAFFFSLLEFPLGKTHFFVMETFPFITGGVSFSDFIGTFGTSVGVTFRIIRFFFGRGFLGGLFFGC